MAAIKLGRLPDRTPVKMMLHLSPDLAQALDGYARFYAEAYGRKEAVADLVPAMLQAFLDGDRAFKVRRQTAR